MAFEKRDLTGSLFKNDKKISDNSPQYTGTITIDGVDYWQSAWVKESKNGLKFFSQSFKRKDAPANQPETPKLIMDDDLPF